MVKFSPGHPLIDILASKLREMPRLGPSTNRKEPWTQSIELGPIHSIPQVKSAKKILSDFSDPWLDLDFWCRDGKPAIHYYASLTHRD